MGLLRSRPLLLNFLTTKSPSTLTKITARSFPTQLFASVLAHFPLACSPSSSHWDSLKMKSQKPLFLCLVPSNGSLYFRIKTQVFKMIHKVFQGLWQFSATSLTSPPALSLRWSALWAHSSSDHFLNKPLHVLVPLPGTLPFKQPHDSHPLCL